MEKFIMRKKALCAMAHPDDCEFTCAGTLALLNQRGWEIIIATLTAGDCGSKRLNKIKISKIRKKEAIDSAKILDGNYFCLDEEDVFILYQKETLLKTIKLIRKVRPTIVFAPSPSDYMIDHEITSKLIQTACFAAGMPNIKTKDIEPFNTMPYLYYADPLEGIDKMGIPIEPSFVVNIDSTMEIKEKMLCCHESQRSWLKEYHKIDEYVLKMKQFARSRGELINCRYGEGFRMHLGHATPKENILKGVLTDFVHELD
ncbi:MAG: PIG-L family deacetylase [Candidatus Lokiarchaeota archaeon]|nr:PIG-L family deacetylase [Candidatus Lokiarchaeota archaeon]